MKFWAKNARKRPKFGSKVAEISETLWPNARNSEKNFWQHCFHGNFITHIGVRGPECQSQLCMSLSGLTLAFGPGTDSCTMTITSVTPIFFSKLKG